jgi:hypothetical protein
LPGIEQGRRAAGAPARSRYRSSAAALSGAISSLPGAGQAKDLGGGGVEGVEPVQRLRRGPGDAERIHQDDLLSQLAAGAGGDSKILALAVEDEGGARS